MATVTTTSVVTVRERLRRAAKKSGMTQEEIGLRMGFEAEVARQAVSRLINPRVKHDPRLSTLLRLANAIGKSLNDLI